MCVCFLFQDYPHVSIALEKAGASSSDREASGHSDAHTDASFATQRRVLGKRDNRYLGKLNLLLKWKFGVDAVGDISAPLKGKYRRAYFAAKQANTLEEFRTGLDSFDDSKCVSSN